MPLKRTILALTSLTAVFGLAGCSRSEPIFSVCQHLDADAHAGPSVAALMDPALGALSVAGVRALATRMRHDVERAANIHLRDDVNELALDVTDEAEQIKVHAGASTRHYASEVKRSAEVVSSYCPKFLSPADTGS